MASSGCHEYQDHLEVECPGTDGLSGITWSREWQFAKQSMIITHVDCIHQPSMLVAPLAHAVFMGSKTKKEKQSLTSGSYKLKS